jgi:hypothetical protein
MEKAYLIPKDKKDANELPDSQSKEMTPISKMDVRSIFVTPEPDSILKVGNICKIIGLAMDGGDGISKVEISLNNGKTWVIAELSAPLGNYAWRRWCYQWKVPASGSYTIKVRATNKAGDSQPERHWNRSGYMRNEIESLTLVAK